MSSVPTDSVLRRHHEQMRQAARAMPTDSVLRRHHDQMRQAARLEAESSRTPEPAEWAPAPEAATPASAPAPAAAEPASAAPQPAARPADAPTPAVSAQGGGGFMGWLKRLFGG